MIQNGIRPSLVKVLAMLTGTVGPTSLAGQKQSCKYLVHCHMQQCKTTASSGASIVFMCSSNGQVPCSFPTGTSHAKCNCKHSTHSSSMQCSAMRVQFIFQTAWVNRQAWLILGSLSARDTRLEFASGPISPRPFPSSF